MPEKKLESIIKLILGIIDIPLPQVYRVNENTTQIKVGNKNSPMEKALCAEIAKHTNESFQYFSREEIAVDCGEYNFFGSIMLEDKSLLVLISISKKPLNRTQLNGLEQLKKFSYNEDTADGLDPYHNVSSIFSTLSSIKRPSSSPIQQIRKHLRHTLRILEMDYAILSSISDEKYKVIEAFSHDGTVKIGDVYDLKNTYCDITVKAKRTIAIDDMANSAYLNHPCYREQQLESYIGTTYQTEVRFGTLSFSGRAKRNTPFSAFEVEFVKYIKVLIENLLKYQRKEKALQHERQLTRAFVKSVPVAVAMLDKDLNYLEASEEWIRTYSIDRDITGISHYDLFPEVSLEWREFHQRALQGEILKRNEDRFVRADGSVQYLNWRLTPWYDDNFEVAGIIMYVEDITKRVMEKQQQQEVVEQKALSAIKVKEEFAYIASHDLQEPVRSIMSVSNVLLKKHANDFNDEAEKLIRYINENSNRMNLLIKGLLDYGRLGRNTTLTLIPISQVIEDIEEDLRQLINENSATIKTKKLPEVYGYETEIRILFQNLITNAIKFRKQDEEPLVEIQCEEKQNHWLFSVSDNGLGIAKKDQKKVFQLFKKLHSRKTYKGIGIGLSHCWRIVEMHSGKIWVESTKDVGSTFYFTLNKNISTVRFSAN